MSLFDDLSYPLLISGTAVELSSRVEYALLALMEMAARYSSHEPLKMSEITAHQAIPDRYLEQIMSSLRRHGLIQSQRGAKGGYGLAKEPWQITLLEIVLSIEGNREPKETEQATLEKQLIHEVWQGAIAASHTVLKHITLQDLCQKREIYRQSNPMYYI